MSGDAMSQTALWREHNVTSFALGPTTLVGDMTSVVSICTDPGTSLEALSLHVANEKKKGPSPVDGPVCKPSLDDNISC